MTRALALVRDARRAAGGVQRAMSSWNDPVARHARALRRARSTLRYRALVTTGLGGVTAAAIPLGGGLGPADLGWAAATAAGVAATFFSWRDLRALRRVRPPTPVVGRQSSAGVASERLHSAHGALDGLLPRLGSVATDTSADAAAAETAFADLIDRVTAVEAARDAVGGRARLGLEQACRVLAGQLNAGVLAYETFVAAAAECVAAGSAGVDSTAALERLRSSTDQLTGLAHGLAEISPQA